MITVFQLRKVENGWIVTHDDSSVPGGFVRNAQEWVFVTIEEAAAKIKELSDDK